MYRNIMAAVDNSEWSGYAVDLAVDLAAAFKARLTGSHVYAARLHGTRFQQIEPGLPGRYQSDETLQRLRSVHGDLIGRGLGIISDSYLRAFEERCRAAGIAAERRVLEGRNYEELARDVRESRYDLVVLGAYGLGRVDRSVLGSVCERLARLVDCDVLVARDGRLPRSGALLVAIDGSPSSFAALDVALDLAVAFGSPVSAVAAYDPFFHGVAFQSIAGVLTPDAAKLFRFQEQETLHDEIIDKGLMEVYRSQLVRAQARAKERGIDLEVEVLAGKPFDAIAAEVARTRPALLVVGRVGIHHGEGVSLGSTAENLLRTAGCNVLVAGGAASEQPEAGPAAEETASAAPRWTDEAAARLARVPWFVRNLVRGRVESYARDEGQALITPAVFDQAVRRFGR